MRNPRVLVVLLVMALVGAAHADKKDTAREAFHEGTRRYDIGDFGGALKAFKEAYLNYEDPAFLFNIAQCQRALGDKLEALRTYRVFVSKLPPGSRQRAQVEKITVELQAAIDQDKVAITRPPVGMLAPANSTAPTTTPPPPAATEEPPPVAPAPAAVVVVAPTTTEKPITKKGWFWGVVAGGVVVVAGAVALGVVFGTRHSNSPVELQF